MIWSLAGAFGKHTVPIVSCGLTATSELLLPRDQMLYHETSCWTVAHCRSLGGRSFPPSVEGGGLLLDVDSLCHSSSVTSRTPCGGLRRFLRLWSVSCIPCGGRPEKRSVDDHWSGFWASVLFTQRRWPYSHCKQLCRLPQLVPNTQACPWGGRVSLWWCWRAWCGWWLPSSWCSWLWLRSPAPHTARRRFLCS